MRTSRARFAPTAALLVAAACATAHESDDAGADAGTEAVPPTRHVPGWDIYEVAYEEPHDFGLGSFPQLVIDAHGTFHISHMNQNDGAALYSHGTPGHFETERVGVVAATLPAPFSDYGRAAEAVAPDGTVHIAYARDATLGAARARRSVDGMWTVGRLPFADSPYPARQPAVAVLLDGAPMFAGVGEPVSPLRHVDVAVGDGPATVIGDGEDSALLAVAMATMRDGIVHVIFNVSDVLFMATRSVAGDWSTAVELAEMTAVASLTGAPDGTLHIALVRYDGTSSTLMHVSGPAGGDPLVEEVVLVDPLFLEGTSIAVAPSGVVHIAYEEEGVVLYATNAGGAWHGVLVDEVSSQNGRPVIAVDPSGTPWIAYRDFGSALVVATPH